MHNNGQDLGHDLVKFLDHCTGVVMKSDRQKFWEVVPDGQIKLTKHRIFLEWPAGQEVNQTPVTMQESEPVLQTVLQGAPSEYEQRRFENICRNRDQLRSFGLCNSSQTELIQSPVQIPELCKRSSTSIPQPEPSQQILAANMPYEVTGICLIEWLRC